MRVEEREREIHCAALGGPEQAAASSCTPHSAHKRHKRRCVSSGAAVGVVGSSLSVESGGALEGENLTEARRRPAVAARLPRYLYRFGARAAGNCGLGVNCKLACERGEPWTNLRCRFAPPGAPRMPGPGALCAAVR